MNQSTGQRERDLDRFLTFVDAVVAIAITLLVLPLADVAQEAGEESVTELLREHKGELLGFLLSFLVIAQLWFSQHRVVSSLVRQDPVVVRLLTLWMFTIVVLPFPTALVAESGEEAATKTLYIGTMALSALTLALVAVRMAQRPDLRDPGPGPDPLPAAAVVAAFLLALMITLVFPDTGYWPLLLLLLADPVARRWRGVRGGGPTSPRVGE